MLGTKPFFSSLKLSKTIIEGSVGIFRKYSLLDLSGNDVVLNQVLVAFGDDAKTNAVIADIQAGGEIWCSGTHWHGRDAMRISVSSWATTDADIERALAAIVATVSRRDGE